MSTPVEPNLVDENHAVMLSLFKYRTSNLNCPLLSSSDFTENHYLSTSFLMSDFVYLSSQTLKAI